MTNSSVKSGNSYLDKSLKIFCESLCLAPSLQIQSIELLLVTGFDPGGK